MAKLKKHVSLLSLTALTALALPLATPAHAQDDSASAATPKRDEAAND